MRKLFLFLGLIGLITTLNCSRRATNTTEELDKNWSFRQVGESDWLPASVPGSVHTDLMDLGKIQDPYYSFNEADVQWIEDEDWEYKTTFSISKKELQKSIELKFHGLDTYADIYINDSLLARTDNMFLGHSFDVKDFLQRGKNELRVYFHSPVKIGLERKEKIGYSFPNANELADEERRTAVFSRKAPFHYGWDWGPRLVTSGIWQPVELMIYDKVKLKDEHFKLINLTEEIATYEAVIEVKSNSRESISADVIIDDQIFEKTVQLEAGINRIRIPFEIEEPKLWWSNGLGEANLYDVTTRITSDGKLQDQATSKIGVRTIEFVQEADSVGESFYFKLNGRPVFMKGANYIPSDHLVTRQDESVYRRALMDAKEANMNTLRVWGGAIYEKDKFYELADELGIMIWQDFMFACAMYPNDNELIESINKEAEYNVNRLKNYPSVVFWCGNNENSLGWNNWGWQEEFDDSTRAHVFKGYEKVFYDVLPKAVNKYDSELAYWPSSPQSTYRGGRESLTQGDTHEWSVWFSNEPIEHYWNRQPRFSSEYGVQSYPSIHTINRFADDSSKSIRSELMEFRQRSKLDWIAPGTNGIDMIEKYNGRYYKVPKDFESFIYVSQLMQAKAFATAIDAHRSNMPVTMGSLYWQLNDTWPTISWSSVDYYGNWKPSHYAVKEAFKDTRLVLRHKDDKVQVYLLSDMMNDDEVSIEITVADFAGSTIQKEILKRNLPSNRSELSYELAITDNMLEKKENLYLQARLVKDDEIIDERYVYLLPEKELQLKQPAFTFEMKKSKGKIHIELESDVLAKNVWISTTDSEVRLDKNNFDLAPGKTIVITSEDRSFNPKNLVITSLWNSYN